MTVPYNALSGQMEAADSTLPWCCPDCEVLWRGRSVCWCCDGPGVRWDGKGPEGWPVLTTGPREQRG
jgi:hypothetical protein